MGAGRAALGSVLAALLLFAVVPVAASASGALDYAGCVGGQDFPDPDPCELVPDAGTNGTHSGLDGVESVTPSPDGRYVYAVARIDDSIARFHHAQGELVYRGCVSGDSGSACEHTPTAVADGASSGLDDVRAMAISKDGKTAYAVVAGDDALAWFERNVHNGKLAFQGCVTGNDSSGPGGSGACQQIPSAAGFGLNSGLDHPKSLVLSADGKSLYVAATEDAAIGRFKLAGDGTPVYKDCVAADSDASGPPGTAPCAETPVSAPGANDTGFDDPRGLVITNKGKTLLGVSSDDDALFAFDRNTRNGKLEFDSCLTGEQESGSICDEFHSTSAGTDSGFDDTRSLAVSKDGRSTYVVSRFDAAVYLIPRSGTPTCYSGDLNVTFGPGAVCEPAGVPTVTGYNSGLGYAESVVISRDQKSVYVSASNDAAVATFKRNTTNGKLDFKRCISGTAETGPTGTDACKQIPTATATGTGSGIEFPQFMALSPDDESLYAAIGQDDAVATFTR